MNITHVSYLALQKLFIQLQEPVQILSIDSYGTNYQCPYVLQLQKCLFRPKSLAKRSYRELPMEHSPLGETPRCFKAMEGLSYKNILIYMTD